MSAWTKFINGLIGGIHARAGIPYVPRKEPEPEPVKPNEEKTSIELMFDELWPGSSDEARHELIWMTPYPFVDELAINESLIRMREKWGPKIGDAIQGEMNDFDNEWNEYKLKHPEQFE